MSSYILSNDWYIEYKDDWPHLPAVTVTLKKTGGSALFWVTSSRYGILSLREAHGLTAYDLEQAQAEVVRFAHSMSL